MGVVEVDDPSHEFRDETVRIHFFQSLGSTVLRFANNQIAQELPEVASTHIREHGEAPE